MGVPVPVYFFAGESGLALLFCWRTANARNIATARNVVKRGSASIDNVAAVGYDSHRMLMRIRFEELLKKHEITPYELSKRSAGRISMSTAYRLKRNGGRVQTFDAEMLEALCDVFGVGPGELLERDAPKRRKAG